MEDDYLFILIILILVVLLGLSINSQDKMRKNLDDSNKNINELVIKNNEYEVCISELQSKMDTLNKKDTIIKIKYIKKIDTLYTFTLPDYVNYYDTSLNTILTPIDTFLCLDSMEILNITKKLITARLDSELLYNCNSKLIYYDSIINYKDSLIDNKDSEITVLNDINKEKIKKLKKQRNTFAGAALLEFLVILGLISK